MPNWYVAHGKERLGPYDSESMRNLLESGRILPTDMVSKEGTQTWGPAGAADFNARSRTKSAPEKRPASSKGVKRYPVARPATAGPKVRRAAGAATFPMSSPPSAKPFRNPLLIAIAGGVAVLIVLGTVLSIIAFRSSPDTVVAENAVPAPSPVAPIVESKDAPAKVSPIAASPAPKVVPVEPKTKPAESPPMPRPRPAPEPRPPVVAKAAPRERRREMSAADLAVLELGSNWHYFNRKMSQSDVAHPNVPGINASDPNFDGRSKIVRAILVRRVLQEGMSQKASEFKASIDRFPGQLFGVAIRDVFQRGPFEYDSLGEYFDGPGRPIENAVRSLQLNAVQQKQLTVGMWLASSVIADTADDTYLRKPAARVLPADSLEVVAMTHDEVASLSGYFVRVRNQSGQRLTNVLFVSRLKTTGANDTLSKGQLAALGLNEVTGAALGVNSGNAGTIKIFKADNLLATMPQSAMTFVKALEPGDVVHLPVAARRDKKIFRGIAHKIECDQGRLEFDSLPLKKLPSELLADRLDAVVDSKETSPKGTEFAVDSVWRGNGVGASIPLSDPGMLMNSVVITEHTGNVVKGTMGFGSDGISAVPFSGVVRGNRIAWQTPEHNYAIEVKGNQMELTSQTLKRRPPLTDRIIYRYFGTSDGIGAVFAQPK
jgi:GYF domain 2